VATAFTMPTHTRINAVELSREARALLDRFDQTESGDFIVLTSKGQQEALFALEYATASVTAPILRLDHGLHKFSAFIVMPLFAFANAGVRIGGPREHASVTAGALLGLVIGKPIGILWQHLALSNPELLNFPAVVGWASLLGYTCLAGIGFTMSLFVAMLAFDETGPLNAAKSGILAGSFLAGIASATVLRIAPAFRDDQ
jgi:NhaA family Na+:H+ antiporter